MYQFTSMQFLALIAFTFIFSWIIARATKRSTYIDRSYIESSQLRTIINSLRANFDSATMAKIVVDGMSEQAKEIITTFERAEASRKVPVVSKVTKKNMQGLYAAASDEPTLKKRFAMADKKRKQKPRTEAQKARARELMRVYRAKKRSTKK